MNILESKRIVNKSISEIKRIVNKIGEDKKVIIGISGGADSALSTVLLVEALGKDRVVGIMLPYDKQTDIDDSKKLAQDLEIEYKIINIKPMVDEFIKAGCLFEKMVRANIMARVRMTVLYAIANEVNGVVAGTTNKSELAIGYGTKYGDLACDFEVIMDLYKTEVWQILRYLASELKINFLIKIADKKPTAGLWAGQSDEGEFGFSYEELDGYLAGKKVTQETEQKIIRMIQISEHKRKMPPFIKLR